MTSIMTVVEIILFCLGGVLIIYRPELRFSEIVSAGIVIGLLTISCIFQASFLVGIPNLSFVIECLIVLWTIIGAIKRRKDLLILGKKVKIFFLEQKIIVLLLSFALIYLALQATLLPVGNSDSMTYNLARVLVFQQEKTLFLGKVEIARQEMFPVGADILHHAFLRFYNDYGIAIFSFLAYISVGLGTYALSRRYTSREIALTATLVIVSLPEFVLQATSTKNDIFTAAVAVFCLLTVHRILDSLNLIDLYFLVLGLLFGISIKTTFIAFVIPFTLIFGYLFIKKYEVMALLKYISKNWKYIPLLLVPAFILSQIWLFIHNYFLWGGWAGPPDFVILHQQVDGIKGGLANLVRYIFQSIDLLHLVDSLCKPVLGFHMSHALQKIYELLFNPLFGNAGMAGLVTQEFMKFSIEFKLNEDGSWFGPFGFLLVIPAVVWTATKGEKALKAISFTLLGCFFLMCYQIGWMPWNNRFLSLLFASSGVCVAYFLEKFNHKKLFVNLVKYISILILFYACIFNTGKPLLSYNALHWFQYVTHKSIWAKTNFGSNRFYYADAIYGDSRVTQFPNLVPPGSKVALVTDIDTAVYHYFLLNPQVKFTSVKQSSLGSKALNFDYILCLNVKCELSSIDSANSLWNSQPPAGDGQLIKISHIPHE